MAKAKVTPLRLKTETAIKEIPRLELMAALLAARLSKTIIDIIQNVNLKRSFWCDSEVVLRWILNPNQKLVKYAVGPVEEILALTDRENWKYVPTELNVADLCTKMKKFDFSCNNSVWMAGPDFIRQEEEQWPKLPDKLLTVNIVTANNIYIEKLKYSTHVLPALDCPIANDDAIDRLSASIQAKWTKLTRATARALKLHLDLFIPLVRTGQFNNDAIKRELKRLTNNVELLQSIDIERAEHFIFRKIQRDEFPVEYKALKEGKQVKNPMMQQLNVFMDPQGIIRINARTNVNKECHPQQFVPLLPRKNVFVTNLLAYYHYKYEHVATETQIADLRSKVWIPQLRTALRSIRSRCNWCRIKKAMPFSPKMAPLPNDRVNAELKPFEVTGIDVIGPLRPTVNGNIKKVYILIFVCTLTRYIHLHILDSMESLRILEAIVTFWTAYGPVRKFVSDNASNFKRTAKTLEEDYHREKVFNTQLNALGPKLSEVFRVEWQFIPVHAPWFGAVYERLIKEVKRMLASTLEKRKVNRVELNIAVQEAAHRINCRPLTENPLDAADSEILTPHHLVKNKNGWPVLPGIHKNVYSTIPDRSIYKRGRAVANEMMQKFTSRYLPELTRRTKWHKTDTVPRVGDLVLVIEPNQTRREWKRGKITKVHLGKDGIARVADVKMANGIIKNNRAIRNLAKLSLTTSLHEEEKPNGISSNLTVVKNSKANVSSIFELTDSTERSEVSYSLVANKNIFTRCSKQVIDFNFSEMKRNSSFIPNSSLIVQFDGVSRNMVLSRIVEELEPELKSIIGIARVFDYKAQVNLKSIYLLLQDREEYRALTQNHRSIKLTNDASLSFPNLSVKSAYFHPSFETAPESMIEKLPMPLALLDLPMLHRNTTRYVSTILKTFERLTEVKSFRWCLSETGSFTRPFGFLLVPKRDQVLSLAGQTFQAGDALIQAKISDSASILIHGIDADLFDYKNKAYLDKRIVAANLFHRDAPLELPKLTVTVTQKPKLCSVAVPTQRSTLVTPKASSSGEKTANQQRTKAVIHSHTKETASSTVVAKVSTGTLLSHSAVPDDTLLLTLNDDEKFDEEPGCSKSLVPTISLADPRKAIQEQATVPANIGENTTKNKKARKNSTFARFRVTDKFAFKDFVTQVMGYIKRHKYILYVEGVYGSTAYIEFEDERDAAKFKKVVEGIRVEREFSVSLSENSAKRRIEKGIARTSKPTWAETHYFMEGDLDSTVQCLYGGVWGKLSFPPPQLVPN